jgi:hypothetical protein
MNQTLHIFAKDTRRFWPEILLSFVLLAAFVAVYPQQWAPIGYTDRSMWLPNIITGLVPVSWLVLITRIVHAEGLVGDRQFWITRPYRWPMLMAAKASFLLVFLYLPFLMAQAALLHEAGFRPTSFLNGLFFNLLFATAIAVLPLVTLATITSNFGKMVLAILIVGVFAAAAAFSSTLLPTADASSSFGERPSYVLTVTFLLSVIFIQYATRRTLLSRALVIAFAITVALLAVFGPDDMPMNLTYQKLQATQHGPLTLNLSTGQKIASETPLDQDDKKEIVINFPVSLSGAAPGTAIQIDAAKVAITSADGQSWTSHWQGASIKLLPGQIDQGLTLKVNRPFFDRTKNIPVTATISVAITTLRAGRATRVSLSEGEFRIPGQSICFVSSDSANDISCRSPLRQASLMLAKTRFSMGPCSVQSTSDDSDVAFGWFGTLNDDPAEFGITSVWTSSIYLQRQPPSTKPSGLPQHICPGSPIAFLPYTPVDRIQEEATGSNLRLADYARNTFAF